MPPFILGIAKDLEMVGQERNLKRLVDELLAALSARPTSVRIASDPDSYFEFIHALELAAFKIRDFNNER